MIEHRMGLLSGLQGSNYLGADLSYSIIRQSFE